MLHSFSKKQMFKAVSFIQEEWSNSCSATFAVGRTWSSKIRARRAALHLCEHLSVAHLDSQALFTEVHIGIFRQYCACCGMSLKWPTM